MADQSAFDLAKFDLSRAHERNTSICDPFLSIVPLHGAAVSVLAVTIGQSTMCASDATSACLDELQLDLGEGPCWQALGSGRPVFAPDLRRENSTDWPVFAEAVRNDPRSRNVEAIFAFPLLVGSLEIGAVDLYSRDACSLTDLQVTRLSALSRIAAWQVLRTVLSHDAEQETGADDRSLSARREVHQATGMVLAQLDITADDAAVLLRAHAFASGRSMRAVAQDVVARRIDFSRDVD